MTIALAVAGRSAHTAHRVLTATTPPRYALARRFYLTSAQMTPRTSKSATRERRLTAGQCPFILLTERHASHDAPSRAIDATPSTHSSARGPLTLTAANAGALREPTAGQPLRRRHSQ